MANRTVIVDNNTWNNTHIATVGRAMSSPERKAWHIYRSLDVDYVLVVFGGFIGCGPRSGVRCRTLIAEHVGTVQKLQAGIPAVASIILVQGCQTGMGKGQREST